MGQDIEKEDFAEADYREFSAQLQSDLAALQLVLARPHFGAGETTIGTELELDWDDVTFEGANTSLQVHLRVAAADFADTYNAAQLTMNRGAGAQRADRGQLAAADPGGPGARAAAAPGAGGDARALPGLRRYPGSRTQLAERESRLILPRRGARGSRVGQERNRWENWCGGDAERLEEPTSATGVAYPGFAHGRPGKGP